MPPPTLRGYPCTRPAQSEREGDALPRRTRLGGKGDVERRVITCIGPRGEGKWRVTCVAAIMRRKEREGGRGNQSIVDSSGMQDREKRKIMKGKKGEV